MKKRILSILLVEIMLATMIPMNIIEVNAGKGDAYSGIKSGDYYYIIESEVDKTARIDRYVGSATDLAIPSVLDGYIMIRIADSVFSDCDSLTSIIIPNSVTEIGISAFSDCDSLTSVVIGNNVETIGDKAFYNCSSLASLTIPDSVTTIGNSAFYMCHNLASVTISDSVTTIGDYVFAVCNSLTSVTIPDSVTTIGVSAFENCIGLTSVTVDSENQFYSSDEYGVLFDKAKTKLIQYPIGKINSSYAIPNSVTAIGGLAFFSCDNLTSVIIPDSVTVIGVGAFSDCDSLTSVVIGDNVKTIGDRAFYNCYSLTSVIIPDSVTVIGNSAFYLCYNLVSIIIPDSVTSIGDYAFSCCYNLISVKIPESVITIGGYVFTYCYSLTSIVIGNNVKTIGDKAFYRCDSLKDVYYSGAKEEWISISIGIYNWELRNATIHYNYTPPFTGIKDNHFYKDDVMQKAYQLVEFDGDFYYIGDRHEIVKNKKVYIKEDRLNGLTYADGTPITAGYYDFDENGKMVIIDGIVGNKVYKNNTQLKAYQLVEVDGDFYYIGDRHEIVKNKKIYIKAERLNGLTYADGTPITAGYYEFDEEGKMVILNGVVGNKIYKNNTQLKAYQLVEVDGYFYYIGDRHEIVKNKTVYVKADRINGLTYEDGTLITAGYYDFDENGKMIIK